MSSVYKNHETAVIPAGISKDPFSVLYGIPHNTDYAEKVKC